MTRRHFGYEADIWDPSAPVAVGIDGSDAAINTALWAIDEAISRDVALKLVHAVAMRQSWAEPEVDYRMDVQYAESALRAATAAVEATGREVKLETEVLWGTVDQGLICESRNASLLCVGSIGVSPLAGELLGSTAVTLADRAFCPVAVVRTLGSGRIRRAGRIVVIVEDRADNEKVIETAMLEARLRNSPLLAVEVRRRERDKQCNGGRLARILQWQERYPDVQVDSATTRFTIAEYVAGERADSVQLVVVGAADAQTIATIVGSNRYTPVPSSGCSVLVVR